MVGGRFSGYRAILFDYGGTLDSDGLRWPDRFLALYEEANIGVPHEEIERAFYYAEDRCYADPKVAVLDLRGLIRKHVRLQFETLGLKDRRKEQQLVDNFCAMSEKSLAAATPMLKRAKSVYRLGIVSNFYGNLAHLLKHAGIYELVDVVIDSNCEGVQKPDPAIFRLALAQLGVLAQQVIFVGDSYERDMIPSRALGMKTVWLRRPGAGTREAPEADACISSFSELEALIL